MVIIVFLEKVGMSYGNLGSFIISYYIMIYADCNPLFLPHGVGISNAFANIGIIEY
jgi:hypothetical protein